MIDVTNKKIAVVSHVYAPGPPHALEAYLKDRVRELLFIGHPFAFMTGKTSQYRRYKDGKLVKEWQGQVWRMSELPLSLRDFLTNLVMLSREPFDMVIALDNLNAASALWVRALGRVKMVIFYTIDYIPQRFSNSLLNRLYHGLDNYCVKAADYVWNLSIVMTEMRGKKGIAPTYRDKQLVVPIGTDPVVASKQKRDPNLIVFMGHLRPGQGVELLVEAMPIVLDSLPKAKLRLIGGGPLEESLRQRVAEMSLGKAVELTGFVPTNEAMRELLEEGAIAVAPYVDDEKSYTRYTDPGKPKEYLAAGLPVVITRVPQFAETIDKEGAGKAINYDKQELATAIIELLGSKSLESYQKKAKQLAARFTWEKVFTTAFKEMDEKASTPS